MLLYILFMTWNTDLIVFGVGGGACFCPLVVISSQFWCPSDGGSYASPQFLHFLLPRDGEKSRGGARAVGLTTSTGRLEEVLTSSSVIKR